MSHIYTTQEAIDDLFAAAVHEQNEHGDNVSVTIPIDAWRRFQLTVAPTAQDQADQLMKQLEAQVITAKGTPPDSYARSRASIEAYKTAKKLREHIKSYGAERDFVNRLREHADTIFEMMT